MKYLFTRAAPLLLISALNFASTAFATVPPTLSVLATGGGDNVQISVTGDPSASVLLSYTMVGVGAQIASLGSTDGSGSFSMTISSANYGLTTGTLVTAIVGGTGGPRSPTVAWPTVSAGTNSLTLSQNALVLNVGSSATVTATPQGSAALYLSNNSNSSIANVSLSGNQVTMTGNIPGVTTVSICQIGNTTNCPTIYITVLQAGSSQLSFSQNNATLVSGQNLPITISGGNGSYLIKNNSNQSIIQASISGSVLTLTTGSTSGSSSITVCTSDMSLCAVISASAGSANSVAISFSTSAPIVSAGQSTIVNIYGPTGVQFYVSSNANPAIVQANLSGSTLTLSGITAGSSSISVCATTSMCASLNVTVQNALTGGSITLSQNTVSILAGQNINITVSGGEQPYFVSGGSSSVAQQTVSGNALTVIGIAPGTSSVNVCSAGGGCVMLVITVNGTGATAAFSANPTSVSLGVGQSAVVSLSGTGSYNVSANTSPSVASITVNGSGAAIVGLSPGITNATICETSGPCLTLPVTVNTTAVTPTPVVTPTPPVQTPFTPTAAAVPVFTFTKYLTSGSSGDEVTELQNLLAAQGVFTATPNGNYGPQTKAAVMKFQAAHGISQLGVVGPSTRSALNQIENANVSSGEATFSAIATMNLVQLQAEVQLLQSQLTQALNRITQLTGH
jgi:hypothetical protein